HDSKKSSVTGLRKRARQPLKPKVRKRGAARRPETTGLLLSVDYPACLLGGEWVRGLVLHHGWLPRGSSRAQLHLFLAAPRRWEWGGVNNKPAGACAAITSSPTCPLQQPRHIPLRQDILCQDG